MRHMDVEQRFAKIDRRLDAITKIIRFGMKLVAQTADKQKENSHEIRALIDAQQRSEEKLDRLMEALLKQQSNGHQ